MAALSILRPGVFTTVQDLGRWGFQSRGVPVSGAMDWYSHRLANLLVGNDPDLATLEVTLAGPQLRFESKVIVAVTGGYFHLTLDDVPIEMDRAIEVQSGAVMKFGERVRGARAYIAVQGGIDVPRVLGSRSTHVLTGMGGHQGRALKAGDTIPLGVKGEGRGANVPHPLPLTPFAAKLRAVPADARLFAHIASRQFQVSPRSNRMGYLLDGGSVGSDACGAVVSTAVPTGTIQVPPSGSPILLMNDHATTGGYAIAGVVITADLPLAGQLAPGESVAFEACSRETAAAELRQREISLGGG